MNLKHAGFTILNCLGWSRHLSIPLTRRVSESCCTHNTILILLLRSIKKHPRQLCYVAGWILLMQLLDIYLVVLPSLHGTGVHVSVWDFVALVAVGATLAFVYLRVVGKASLFPVRDPRLVESLNLMN